MSTGLKSRCATTKSANIGCGFGEVRRIEWGRCAAFDNVNDFTKFDTELVRKVFGLLLGVFDSLIASLFAEFIDVLDRIANATDLIGACCGSGLNNFRGAVFVANRNNQGGVAGVALDFVGAAFRANFVLWIDVVIGGFDIFGIDAETFNLLDDFIVGIVDLFLNFLNVWDTGDGDTDVDICSVWDNVNFAFTRDHEVCGL